MKNFMAAVIGICLLNPVFAQKPDRASLAILKQKEDSLKPYSWKMITGINTSDRFVADSSFTRGFVRALTTRNSFYYPFDSLQTVSKIYAPDSSFRIFTWQLMVNENLFRQHGAIQMRTEDGSLKLFPLIDRSDNTENVSDTISDISDGLVRYIINSSKKKSGNLTYYTLLGFDENNIRSTKKVVDVLSFENGKPRFGAKIFNIPNNKPVPDAPARYFMEFKKDANPRMVYDPELDMIVMEHLVSESNEPNKKWTLIPDGDYEGLQWKNGRWVYVEKLFSQVTPEGKAPVPAPMNESKIVVPPGY